MAPNIDISDKNAWDDSQLISSWDDAVAEYKKYHSIHKSGKRLEDVLTLDELKALREDYDDVLEDVEVTPQVVHTNGIDAEQDADVSSVETANKAQTNQSDMAEREQDEQTHQHQSLPSEPATAHVDLLGSAMPQAILGTVEDENLKNIMMSWYYAGYYTGLHAGQQQASKNTTNEQ